jgi:hypothetical protein
MEREAKMGQEQDRLRNILIDKAEGNDYGHKLAFDPDTKRVRPVSTHQASGYNDPDGGLNLIPEDHILFF